jgi:flagellar basal-body rod protein FlgB
MPIRLFDSTINLLEKALDVRSDRHRAIAANIANQDTPGYQAAHVDFKDAMRTASENPSSPLSPFQTDPRHLSGGLTASVSSSRAAVPTDRAARLDGNTVDSEKEMVDLAENTLMYTASVQMISAKFKTLINAIREGR